MGFAIVTSPENVSKVNVSVAETWLIKPKSKKNTTKTQILF